jgi:hypothetical protein
MSIVRVSVIGNRVFSPDSRTGELRDADRAGLGADPSFVGPLGRCRPETPNAGYAECLMREVRARTPDLGRDGPVAVLVHGFLYDPAAPADAENPHGCNYHFAADTPVWPCWRHQTSWPLGLGFRADDGGERGLVVGFGWDSTPRLLKLGAAAAVTEVLSALVRMPLSEAFRLVDEVREFAAVAPRVATAFRGLDRVLERKRRAEMEREVEALLARLEPSLATLAPYTPDFYREAYVAAAAAAPALVDTLAVVAAALPGRRIDLFCHSLGSRVVIEAVRLMAAGRADALGRVGRVVVVGGAEYGAVARRALAAAQNAALAGPSFYNFITRRDRVLSHVAGLYHPVDPALTTPIGCHGLGGRDPHWLDLQLDEELDGAHPLNAWLRDRGAAVVEGPRPAGAVAGAHPVGVLNHWHYFTHPANMALFAAILRDRAGVWDIARMRRDRVPTGG